MGPCLFGTWGGQIESFQIGVDHNVIFWKKGQWITWSPTFQTKNAKRVNPFVWGLTGKKIYMCRILLLSSIIMHIFYPLHLCPKPNHTFFLFFLPYIPIPRVHCLHVWIPDWKDQLLAFAWAFREELLGLTAWMNQNLGCLSLSLSRFLSLSNTVSLESFVIVNSLTSSRRECVSSRATMHSSGISLVGAIPFGLYKTRKSG